MGDTSHKTKVLWNAAGIRKGGIRGVEERLSTTADHPSSPPDCFPNFSPHLGRECLLSHQETKHWEPGVAGTINSFYKHFADIHHGPGTESGTGHLREQCSNLWATEPLCTGHLEIKDFSSLWSSYSLLEEKLFPENTSRLIIAEVKGTVRGKGGRWILTQTRGKGGGSKKCILGCPLNLRVNSLWPGKDDQENSPVWEKTGEESKQIID